MLIKTYIDDSTIRTVKPTPSEVPAICARLAKAPSQITLHYFCTAISNGATFTTASQYKDNIRSKSGWQGQQIFAADIDTLNLKFEEVLDKAYSFEHAKPVIIYESFSSKPKDKKWRVLYISENEVVDAQQALRFMKAIQVHFDSDKSVVDLARLFYGSNVEVAYFNPANIFNSKELPEFKAEPAKEFSSTTIPLTRIHPNLYSEKTISAIFRVKNVIKRPALSRYESIFKSTCALAGTGQLTEDEIIYVIITCIEKSEAFKNYDRTPAECQHIVQSALHWLSKK